MFYNMVINFGICTRLPNDMTVEGKGADDYYTLLSLKVLPCSLEKGCKSFEEMAKPIFN